MQSLSYDDDNDRARGESSLLPSYSLVSVGPDLDELGLRPLEEVVRVGYVEEVEADERRHGRVDPLLRRVLALSQRQSLGKNEEYVLGYFDYDYRIILYTTLYN